MKRWMFIIVLTCISSIMFGQNNPRPSKSRFWLNKQATFQIKAGDILVYDIANGEDHNKLLVTIKDTKGGLTFSYNVADKNKQGTVHLTAASLNTGVNYQNIFANNANLPSTANNKGMLWLSQNNFRQLAAKGSGKTKMDMGDGLETFARSGGSVLKINYKGQEKIMTVYKIATVDGATKKEFSVLTDITNPLIVQWLGNGTITLKEVR